MKIKNEKGIVGADIAISVVVIFIFVSLISILIYNINALSARVERMSEATYIAINEIEQLKIDGYDKYKNSMENDSNNGIVVNNEMVQEGYYKTIKVIDYTDIEGNEDKTPGIVKKATVTISYMYKGEEEKVELSTVLSEGS